MGVRILILAPLKIPVPPQLYGGSERIISYLVFEFIEAGKNVTLIAGKGSKIKGCKLILIENSSGGLISRALVKLKYVFKSYSASFNADVVLSFTRVDYLFLLLYCKKSIVFRFGNPILQKEIDWILDFNSKKIKFICVSQNQIKTLRNKELFTIIHNGTDIDLFKFSSTYSPERYLLFLGRITKNKGADRAIVIAKKTKTKLILAGNPSDEPGDSDFFESQIIPNLGPNIIWVGPVNDGQKQHLLGAAFAMLFPISWDEPFANVVIESLACGTPVIASRIASTSEAIIHGQTGFLCDSEDDFLIAVSKIETIQRINCRRVAQEKFSSKQMALNYMQIINELYLSKSKF
jgi:glycosyltransferase involved in cell wall biosynthesis